MKPDTFIIKHHLKYSEYLILIIYQLLRMKILKKIFLIVFVGLTLVNLLWLIFYPGKNHNWLTIIFQIFTTSLIPILSISVFTIFFTSLVYVIKPRYFKNITYSFTHGAWKGVEKELRSLHRGADF